MASASGNICMMPPLSIGMPLVTTPITPFVSRAPQYTSGFITESVHPSISLSVQNFPWTYGW
jgi:hypothetical protein